MAALETIGAGVGILKGLAGIFGKKPKAPTPAQNIVSQAQGAREAAEKYGFNPLTMLQYGNPGGAISSGSGGAPLASAELLMGSISALDSALKGDSERQRKADQLKVDLAELELERLKAIPKGGAASIGSTPSAFGRSQSGDGSAYVTRDGSREGVQIAGLNISPHLGWSNAEAIEKRYGDFVSWGYGIGVGGADMYNTFENTGPVDRITDAEEAAKVARASERADQKSEEDLELMNADIALWGAAPDGYTADDRPFWRVQNGISLIPPNKRK